MRSPIQVGNFSFCYFSQHFKLNDDMVEKAIIIIKQNILK